MSITTNIYAELLKDSQKTSEIKKSRLSRCLNLNSNLEIIYSIEISTSMREMYIKIGSDRKEYDFPKWKGISIEYAKVKEYNGTDWYLQLRQLPKYESYIFEIIAEDMRKTIAQENKEKDVTTLIIEVLKQWKNFFLMERELVLSQERQQGLFGELMMIKELIEEYGSDALNYWSGANDETHDFYIFSHAIEVKTTSTKSPYKICISSEYQLDKMDINGMLFLRFFALRKSESEGIKIPELVNEIEVMLKNEIKLLERFELYLDKYGYFKAWKEFYSTGFFVRECMDYFVDEDFPAINKTSLKTGIADVKYSVNIELCQKHFITKQQLFEYIGGENYDH